MTFSDILLKSFRENLKKFICLLFHLKNRNYQKLIIFLFFCIFHENRRILNCFHRRYEFCMQKYPNKHIFVEFPDKA